MKLKNVKTMLAVAMIAVVTVFMSSCQKEDLTGDQNQIKGKPGYLTIQLKGSKMRTKAAWDGSSTLTGEKNITNFTVFVLKDDGTFDIAPKYYTSFTDGATIQIPITEAADSVIVIANLGDPYSATSALGSLTTSGTVLPDFDATLDLYSKATSSSGADADAPQNYGNLTQIGCQKITWINNVATAAVPLVFLASRISVEEVTLFGQAVHTLDRPTTSDTIGNPTKKQLFIDMKAQGITRIAITSVSILNAPVTTYLYPREATDNSKTWDAALFTQTPNFYYAVTVAGSHVITSFTDGTYYPTTGILHGLDESSPLITEIGAPINSASYPYFYVWENRDNGDKTSGITLAVIQCQITLDNATEAYYYYTVPLDNAKNIIPSNTGKTFPDYSTKRGVHYRITSNIGRIGSANPYYVPPTLGLTLNQTPWDEIAITANF